MRELADGTPAMRLPPVREARTPGLSRLASPGRIRAEDDDPDAPDPEDDSEPLDNVLPWDEPIYTVAAGVAVIDICGTIIKGYDAFTCWCYGFFCLDTLQAALDELTARSDVAVVVLNINSPGGISTGIPETAAQIRALSATGKLVIAFPDTIACSAAYWLGSQCDRFVCTISADVGSIGTYCALYDYAQYLKAEGIALELFKRGTFKAIGVMGTTLSKEQRAFLDAEVGRCNDRFLAEVRGRRGVVANETLQGQWFDGEQAVGLNLADQLVPGLPALLAGLRAELAAALSAVGANDAAAVLQTSP